MLPDQVPEAVQLVGLLVADHDTVAVLPLNIDTGLTLIETTGTFGMTATAAVSNELPAPLPHVIVNR